MLYEPTNPSLAAARLTADKIGLQGRRDEQQLLLPVCLEIQQLALHLAAAGVAASGQDAKTLGYHLVALESSVSARFPVPGGTETVSVSNSALNVTLARHTVLLVRRLLSQLFRARAAGKPVAAAPLSSDVGVAGNVLDGVLDSAFSRPRYQHAEMPLEASVFLRGEKQGKLGFLHTFSMHSANNSPPK